MSFQPLVELDDAALQKARKELNQTDRKQVLADIEYLRRWLVKHDYMVSRTDSDFILTALRSAKFSYLKAQERIEQFWLTRTEMPEFFRNRSLKDDSVLLELAESGMALPLPKCDSFGRKVLALRLTRWDTTKHDFNDFVKYFTVASDLLWEDQRAHVHGVVVLVDISNMDSDHAAYCTLSVIQKIAKLIQKAYPFRIKSVHIFNYPKVFDTVFSLIKPFLPEKLKQRIVFHGSNLNGLKTHIPESVLPKDYGGLSEPLEYMNGK